MFLQAAVLALALAGSQEVPLPALAAADERVQQTPATQSADPATQPGADQNEQKDQKSEAKEPPTPPHTGLRALFSGYVEDVTHLPSTENMYLTLVGGAAVLATHPADASFNAHLRSHYTLVNNIFWPAKYYGDTPEQVALLLL